MKHVGIEIKFYNLDTFKKQIDVNFIDLDSELVDLNYKDASLIFCHFWRSIYQYGRFVVGNTDLIFSSCFFYVRTMSSFKQYVQNMEGRQALNQLLMYLDIEQYNAILPAKKMQKTQQATLIYK